MMIKIMDKTKLGVTFFNSSFSGKLIKHDHKSKPMHRMGGVSFCE